MTDFEQHILIMIDFYAVRSFVVVVVVVVVWFLIW